MKNLKDYTVGDGVANDTAGVQKCINESISSRESVYVPIGKYKLTSQVTINDTLYIHGDGYASVWGGDLGSLFVTENCNGFLVSTDKPVFIERLEVKSSTNNGIGITLTTSTTNTNTDSVLRDVRFSNLNYGFATLIASRFTLDNCKFEGCRVASCWIKNTSYPDGGDNTVSNCMFSGVPQAHFFWETGGGLKLTNTKMNGGTVGIWLYPMNKSTATGVMNFSNNSIENCVYAFLCNRVEQCQLANIVLTGNELFGTSYSIVTGGVAGNYITHFLATGNVLNGPSILGGISKGLVSNNTSNGVISPGSGSAVVIKDNY